MKETEIIKKVFEAINRNDIEALTEYFDPQIERIEPAGHETAGIYHGIKDFLEQMKKGRGTWAEGTCEPESFKVVGDKVIAFLHARVRQIGKTEWIDGRFADVFTFKDGKITRMQTFWENEEAIAWVDNNSGANL